MITTDLDRLEYAQSGTDNTQVFRSSGTDIPVKDATHIKVYVTTTGTFTADVSSSTVNLLDTAHGHLDGQELTLSAATSLPTGLLANTIYYVVNKATNTFQVSLSSGGDAVAFTTNGSGTLTWTKTLLKAITTDYTISLSGTTATLTWESGKRPADLDKVLLLREVPFEQNTDLQNNSLFEAESVETQLDLIVNMNQQLKNTTARDLKFSDLLVAGDATEAAATLTATSAGRANKSLKFDSLGNLGVTTINVDNAQDYTLEAKSWATEDGIVQTYSETVASNVSPVEYSAKDYAQGDPEGGSSKEWAQDTSAAIDTTFSAKEYAQGTQASTGGSSKNWASQTGADITGGSSGDKSAKSWAIETGGTAPADGSAKEWATATGSAVASSEFSAKEYAQGTAATGGTAKEWAQDTSAAVDTTFSAKEYAQGTQASTGGSAKDYATYTSGGVRGETGDHSAKAWSVGGTGVTGVSTKGASKDWAIGGSGAMANTADGSEFSAKEYSQGVTATGGTSKQWSLGGGSHAIGTAVAGTDYASKAYAQSTTAGTSTYGGSAKGWSSTAYDAAVPGAGSGDRSALHYSTDASNSALAAKASAAAVANSFDLFDDTYLGAMKDPFIFTASSSSGLLLTHAGHGLLDGNIVQVASAGTLPTGLSASTNYYVVNKTTNNFKLALASSGTPIVWSDAGSGVHTWVYGSPTTNGTWTKDSATITVVSNVGIRVGQKVSGTGIPAPTDTPANPIPNVLSIDGTAVVISQNMPAAGSAVATTFSSLGINGPYNTSTDGPSTNNDGEALASGNLFFNSTDNEMRIYDGANWIAASSAGSTSLLIYKYIATGSQTIFTGSDANGATLSYTANNINVFLNGVRLDASDYTATNGTSVVLDVGATVSDELVVTAYKSFTTADMVSASAGGTFNNNVSFGDNNITNVGSIALDSIVADGSNITISTDTTLAAGVDLETSTTGKIKQKGSFMQSSTHQAWVMGG